MVSFSYPQPLVLYANRMCGGGGIITSSLRLLTLFMCKCLVSTMTLDFHTVPLIPVVVAVSALEAISTDSFHVDYEYINKTGFSFTAHKRQL